MEQTNAGSHPRLKRVLGLPSVLLFGLAYMTPLIVYGTYGILAEISHGTVPLSYLVAFIAISFTAMSYGKLVRLYPTAGSAYTYTRHTFNANSGFIIGWAALLGYFFLPMVIWLIGAEYLSSAIPAIPSWVWIILFILITSVLNIVGIELAAKFNIVLMIVQFALVVVTVLLCWHYAVAAAGPGGIAYAEPFFNDVPFSFTVAGAAVAAYSFLGFDAVTTLTEETIEPEKNMPRAILLIAVIGCATFMLASYMLQLAHPGYAFENADAASFEIAKKIGGDIFVTLFLAGLVLAQFASGISAQASVGRLLYAMGRDNILKPRSLFGFIHEKYKTPAINIAIAGAIGLIALAIDITTSTSFINFGAFIAFIAVNLCVIRIYFEGKIKMGVFGGFVFPLLGAVLDFYLLVSLDRMAILLGLAWFVLGMIYLCWLTNMFRKPPPDIHIEEA